ncbi:MAG TPA: A/G-specific adenine glycosylase [Candidatus Paceibacterota bacterium]|nr:A/G-specific adenine glycosylase [Candidatus Paceibacterota bacterium]
MSDISKLLKQVEAYYKKEGRSHLPWRKTRDPYKILVSEVMLQQTQVERVIPFYKNFLRQFPNPKALAKAPLSKVLKAWQGLGYNRRAKYLQQAAVVLAKEGYQGYEKGQKLPGVGPYTQGAIDAFALNKPTVIIETNIRTVFLYFCFSRGMSRCHLDMGVGDAEILPLVGLALGKTKLEPREFYAALMDYGAKLKREGIKLNKQSKHYVKQGKFEGSARQLRGAILRELLRAHEVSQTNLTLTQLTKNLSCEFNKTAEEVKRELERLQKESLVSKSGMHWRVSQ